MDFSTLANSDLLLLIIIAIVVLWILFKVGKNLFKIAGIIFIVILIYLVWSGKTAQFLVEPSLEHAFEKRNINEMYENHCSESKKDKAMCACVVEPVYNDLYDRHRRGAINNFSPEKMAEEVMISYKNQQVFMHQCLKDKNQNKLDILKKFKNAYNSFKENPDKSN